MTDENAEANPFSGLFSAAGQANGAQPVDTIDQSSVVHPNESAPPKKRMETDESKINYLVENIFYFTINKDAASSSKYCDQLVYLDELATCEAPKTEIDLDLLEQALFERLLLPDPSRLVIPKDSKNFTTDVIQKNVITYLFNSHRNIMLYMETKDDCEKKALLKMKRLIFRNAVTAVQQPDLFEGQDLDNQLLALFKDKDVSCSDFVLEFVEEFLLEGEASLGQLHHSLLFVLKSIHKDVAKSNLVSLDLYVFPALHLFAGHRYMAGILLETCMLSNIKVGRGYQETLLGSLLAVSALPKTPTAKCAFFDTPFDQASNVSIANNTLWPAFQHLHDNLHRIFLALLKANPQTKTGILKWLSDCLYSNKSRGKLWNTQVSAMTPESMNCVSDAFMLNLSAVLLRLCQPFCSKPNDPKSLKIDPTYCAVEDEEREEKGVSMKGLSKETCIVPPREVTDGAEALPRSTAKNYNFMTECFFLAHKSLDLGYRVAIERLTTLNRDLNHAQRALADAVAQMQQNVVEALRERIQNDMKKYVTLQVVLFEPQYVCLLSNLHAATCTWLVQVATHSTPKVSPVLESYAPMTVLELKFPLPPEVPETLRCVPEFVVENVIGYVRALRRFSLEVMEERGSALLEAVMSLILVFMGSAERMRNPHRRAQLAECLEALLPVHGNDDSAVSAFGTYYRESLFKEHPHRLQIIPSLLDVFVGIEVTGQSVQFEQKFNYRQPMYIVMDFLWTIDEHRNCFKSLSDEAEANMEAVTPPLFLRFVNLLMNDAVFLLDEALSNMAQIRTMLAARNNNEWDALSPQEREQNNMTLHHTSQIARFDNILGRGTIQALERLTGHVKSVFCHPTMVDRVASMLNYFLLHLVGPNRKNFKVKDFKDYEFDPGATVLDICSIYVHLSDNEGFCLAVSQDGRSYSPQLFKSAEDVLVRICGGELIGPLQTVAERVASLAQRQLEEEEALTDAPDEFLDPIMSTLMLDPVMLPSSRTTVDRTTIARHLLSDQSDPFNRSPLTMDQIKPDDELRKKIIEWIAQKRKVHLDDKNIQIAQVENPEINHSN